MKIKQIKETYNVIDIRIWHRVHQYTGGLWLIHATKHHRDNQIQRLKYHADHPCDELANYIISKLFLKIPLACFDMSKRGGHFW